MHISDCLWAPLWALQMLSKFFGLSKLLLTTEKWFFPQVERVALILPIFFFLVIFPKCFSPGSGQSLKQKPKTPSKAKQPKQTLEVCKVSQGCVFAWLRFWPTLCVCGAVGDFGFRDFGFSFQLPATSFDFGQENSSVRLSV